MTRNVVIVFALMFAMVVTVWIWLMPVERRSASAGVVYAFIISSILSGALAAIWRRHRGG